MAEALLRRRAGDRFEVYSAGLEPKDVHPMALAVLEEIGIDTRGHRSKGLDEFLGSVHFSYLITVCSRAEERCPIFPGMGERIHWPLDDPAAFEGADAEKLAKFRQVRDEIDARIAAWLSTLDAG